MNGDGFGVGVSNELSLFPHRCWPLARLVWLSLRWGARKSAMHIYFRYACQFFLYDLCVLSNTCFDGRLGITPISHVWRKKLNLPWFCTWQHLYFLIFLLTKFSGHVRATTAGSLSLDNCHPFVHGKLMVEISDLFDIRHSDCHYAIIVHAQWQHRSI